MKRSIESAGDAGDAGSWSILSSPADLGSDALKSRPQCPTGGTGSHMSAHARVSSFGWFRNARSEASVGVAGLEDEPYGSVLR